MERYSRNDEVHPQLLDLISKEREWLMKREEETSQEEKKLELRLGPPGEDYNTKNNSRHREESVLSLGYFSKMTQNTGTQMLPSANTFIQFQTAPKGLPVTGKEPSQACNSKLAKLQNAVAAEKKAFSPATANTAVVPNSSQKRTAPAPVVGWPPIRSFRKNLATNNSSSSLKPSPDTQNVVPNKVTTEKQQVERFQKCLFVKINMDGVPIGRKVDLKAYDSYEKLSSAVDQLFRGLLSAQRDTSACGIPIKQEGGKMISGLLDGSGEYTLVYEDNEGDRMLVGDVPWHMFVSTVKRLRVLKSSELSSIFLVGSRQGKNPVDAALK